jgi:hypothetical protein
MKTTQCSPFLKSKLDAGIQGGHLQTKVDTRCAAKSTRERDNQ